MTIGRVLAPGLLPDYIAALSGEAVLKGKSFARLELTPARYTGKAAELARKS